MTNPPTKVDPSEADKTAHANTDGTLESKVIVGKGGKKSPENTKPKSVNRSEKSRKRGLAKERSFSQIPGTDEVLIHCAFNCGISYRVAAEEYILNGVPHYRTPKNIEGRKNWHKVIRRLNAHEAQRCKNRNGAANDSCGNTIKRKRIIGITPSKPAPLSTFNRTVKRTCIRVPTQQNMYSAQERLVRLEVARIMAQHRVRSNHQNIINHSYPAARYPATVFKTYPKFSSW